MCSSFLIPDFKIKGFESIFPFGTMKQTTEWTCSEYLHYTKTKIFTVIRECIPKIDLISCQSNGTFTETYLRCICADDACNDFFPTIEDDTTTTTQSTDAANTTLDTTTPHGNGSANLKLTSVLTAYYFLAISFLCAFVTHSYYL